MIHTSDVPFLILYFNINSYFSKDFKVCVCESHLKNPFWDIRQKLKSFSECQQCPLLSQSQSDLLIQTDSHLQQWFSLLWTLSADPDTDPIISSLAEINIRSAESRQDWKPMQTLENIM